MNHKRLARVVSFRNIYIPALTLVMLFAVFAYVNVEKIIDSIHDDANVLNISGRQRMLSQNLILLGLKHLYNPSQKNKLTLEKNIQLMRSSHKHLINDHKNSAKLISIYDEKKLSIKLDAFLNKLDDCILNCNEKIITDLSDDAQILLPLLSEAVEEYEKINQLKVSQLEKKQLYILITTIMILLLEIIFIFFPASRQIKKHTDQLEMFNKNLENRVKEEVEKNRVKDKHMIQQSRLAQMGEMISMIAHQWRQPLGAISSISSTIELEAELDTINKEKNIKYAKKISILTQHLSQTINDFREFFKPDKKMQYVECNELVDDVFNIIGSSLHTNNISTTVESNCHLGFKTYTNELKQVILNVISNARDALLDSKVKNPLITISSYTEDNKYILNISDNAGGIIEDNIDKIFYPYFSTKKGKNGTGLGLYMSKTIIEDHCKGTISVCNNSEGAVFKIIIPTN